MDVEAGDPSCGPPRRRVAIARSWSRRRRRIVLRFSLAREGHGHDHRRLGPASDAAPPPGPDVRLAAALDQGGGADGGVPVAATLAAMDQGGVSRSLICAWIAPENVDDLQRRGGRLRGAGAGPADRRRLGGPLQADGGGARDPPLRRASSASRRIRVLPWLWELPPTDRRFYPRLHGLLRARRAVLHPDRPHRAADAVRGRAADPTSTRWPSTSRSSGSSAGTSATRGPRRRSPSPRSTRTSTSTPRPTPRRRYPPALVEYMRGHGARKVLFGTQLPDDPARQGARGPRRARARRARRVRCFWVRTRGGCSRSTAPERPLPGHAGAAGWELGAVRQPSAPKARKVE